HLGAARRLEILGGMFLRAAFFLCAEACSTAGRRKPSSPRRKLIAGRAGLAANRGPEAFARPRFAPARCQRFSPRHHLLRSPPAGGLGFEGHSHVLCLGGRISVLWWLVFLSCESSNSSKSQAAAFQTSRNPRGNWAGSLEAGDAVLHLVLHV